ncbi:MAG: hypothetical protein ACI9UU_002919, partial [Candidatus Azotimanducaceae bacterium]
AVGNSLATRAPSSAIDTFYFPIGVSRRIQ